MMAAVLATFCLTSVLFSVIPIRSPATDGEYDPWIDTNDDGIINYQDLGNLATRFGMSGTPINKTDLLLELQARIDVLNSTLSNMMPHNETSSTTTAAISWYGALSWQNMSDMSVEITLTMNSTLLIMFSAQARVTGAARYMYVRAMVDATPVNPPNGVTLTQSDEWASHSYTFYIPDAAPGTHTVNMQWMLYDELTTGQVEARSLTVIALPAS
jgi:hypothetical protein